MIRSSDKIYVAGHTGLVGSSLVRALTNLGYSNILVKPHKELDLTECEAVNQFIAIEKPTYVFLAAAKVGGIQANIDSPADFIYPNMLIQNNIIHACYTNRVKRLIFYGSNCTYPRENPQPMREVDMLTGALEPTSLAYAIAKLSGITMCQAYNKQYGTSFASIIPPTLYGPNDNFDADTGHVLSALISRFHHSKLTNAPYVTVWGTGTVKREFLFADDLADASIHLMRMDNSVLKNISLRSNWVFNVGSGHDISIFDLASLIKKVVKYEGHIRLDGSKPDGTQQKLLDSKIFADTGWKPTTPLEQGIEMTYSWFLANHCKDSHGQT